MILTNVHGIGNFLCGDSAIAGHASGHVATAGVAAIQGQGAHVGAGAGIQKEQPKLKDGKGDGNKGGNKGDGGRGSAPGAITYIKKKQFVLCKGY